MTDLKKFLSIYKDFGLNLFFTQSLETDIWKVYLGNHRDSQYTEKFDGYPGFYSIVYFDKDEKFLKQDFIE